MQMAINIAPEIMDWVVHHVSTEHLTEDMANHLEQWKSGTKMPTFNQIEAFSRATGIPFGYFFLKTPPQENFSFLKYRTIDSLGAPTPSRNLIDTVHDMDNVQGWMRDHLIASDYPKLGFVGSQKESENILNFASAMRKELDFTADCYVKFKDTVALFKFLRLQASNSGVLVMTNGIVENNTRRKLEIDEFRAFTLIDDYAPLVFINSNDSLNAKLFSLLHELAHIWLGEGDFFNDRLGANHEMKQNEIICNAVAAELLVPQDLFMRKWNSTSADNGAKIKTLSDYFRCGATVVARKALDNQFITFQEYTDVSKLAISLYNNAQEKRKENAHKGDFYATMSSRIDHRFFSALLGSLQEGKTLYNDAFRLTNTNRKTFATLADKIRGGTK